MVPSVFRHASRLLLLFAGSAHALAQPTTFTEVSLPASFASTRITALSADGSFASVHGISYDTGFNQGFRFSSALGFEPIGTLSPSPAVSTTTGISGNGSTVVGFSFDEAIAGYKGFRWTPQNGLVALDIAYNPDFPQTSARAVNADGSVIAGTYYPLVVNRRTPFTITNGVFTPLPLVAGAETADVSDISADGTRIAGACTFPAGAGFLATLWTNGVAANLGTAPDATQSFAEGVSDDGRTVVGNTSGGVRPQSAMVWRNGLGLRNLMTVPATGRIASALAVNADGSVIAGGTSGSEGARWVIWRNGEGYSDLGVLLAAQGIDVSAWSDTTVTSISDSGTTLAGWGRVGGSAKSWIVRNLPPVPPMTFAAISGSGWVTTQARAISAGGTAIAGFGLNSSGQSRAFRWSPGGGLQDLATLGGSTSAAYGISADGLVVAGTSTLSTGNSPQSFRWTASGGMQSLGTLSGGPGGTAYGVSEDGSVIVGQTGNPGGSGGGGSGQIKAYRWTASGGMTDLGTLGPSQAGAFAVSPLGTDITGISGGISSPTAEAFRWTSEGMTALSITGASIGRAISNDGMLIVGENTSPSSVKRAFQWTFDDGTVLLDPLPSDTTSAAWAVSGDGVLIGGVSASGSGAERAVLWHPVLGILDLNELLPALGADLTGWTLRSTRAIDIHGVAMTGDGTYNGQSRAWVVRGFRSLCEPIIAASPQDQAACLASNVGITVEALGSGTSYQWRKDGVPLTNGPTPNGSTITGAQTATLTISTARAPDSGAYDCVLSNACGWTATPPANLSICISDFNCDLFSDALDYDAFVGLWLLADPAADVNGDEFTDALDYDAFITGWLAGC